MDSRKPLLSLVKLSFVVSILAISLHMIRLEFEGEVKTAIARQAVTRVTGQGTAASLAVEHPWLGLVSNGAAILTALALIMTTVSGIRTKGWSRSSRCVRIMLPVLSAWAFLLAMVLC